LAGWSVVSPIATIGTACPIASRTLANPQCVTKRSTPARSSSGCGQEATTRTLRRSRAAASTCRKASLPVATTAVTGSAPSAATIRS
jgi:hypothetical protein